MNSKGIKLKGFKVKLLPDQAQKDQIDLNIQLRRFIKNKMLDMQQARYKNGGQYVNTFGMNYLLKVLKLEFPFLKQAENQVRAGVQMRLVRQGIGAGQPCLYEPDLFALRRNHRQECGTRFGP